LFFNIINYMSTAIPHVSGENRYVNAWTHMKCFEYQYENAYIGGPYRERYTLNDRRLTAVCKAP
jgi:hypothetical protein